MAKIAQIQSFVQEYAETIAQVLKVDVTIVDEKSIRIGGTGPYEGKIGQLVPHGSLFRKILETGEHGELGIILNEDKRQICQRCAISNECLELATMGFPIMKQGKTVGVVGIMAFNPEQKERIIASASKLGSFLTHMSSLLESKLRLMEADQRTENHDPKAMEAKNQNSTFTTMIGQSPAFRRLMSEATQISQGKSTVLIRGESGTGKELLAKAIHSASSRNGQPYVVVNCPSIPESLLESELFGYEGGAFTGASREGKLGKFELAQHGTIFLDEIGDLSLALQPKLLRVIQERTVERIGGKKPIPLDVRVIAATNRDLESMTNNGSFRSDLFYRLNVIPLYVPPLRERKEDIEIYLRHFLNKYGQSLGKEIWKVDPVLMQWLKSYHWPGNIRELENIAEYLVLMAKSDCITFAEMPRNLVEKENVSISQGLSLQERLGDYEKSVLAHCAPRGSSLDVKKCAAKELGISLATLYRKLEKYQLI